MEDDKSVRFKIKTTQKINRALLGSNRNETKCTNNISFDVRPSLEYGSENIKILLKLLKDPHFLFSDL